MFFYSLYICSYNNKIVAINTMHGRMHNARVFHSSRLFHYLGRQQEAGERGSWFIDMAND